VHDSVTFDAKKTQFFILKWGAHYFNRAPGH